MAMTLEQKRAIAIASAKLRLSQQTPQDVPAQSESQPSGAQLGGRLGLLDAAANLGSSAVAGPVSGIAGILTAAGNGLGITDTSPANAVNSVADSLTYQPRTRLGQIGADTISAPFRKFARAGNYAGEKTTDISGSPALGAAVNTAIQAAPALLTKGGLDRAGMGGVGDLAKTDAALRLERATSAGYSLTPHQAGKKIGGAVSSIADQSQLERALSLKNSRVTNALAQEEIGIKAGKNVDRAAILAKKDKESAIYGEVARLGDGVFDSEFKSEVASITDRSGAKTFPGDTPPTVKKLQEYYSGLERFSSNDVVSKVRQLRRDGFKNQMRNRSPEENAAGDAQIKIANALDNLMERHASSLGKNDLVSRYKKARVNLAKIYSVERAIRGTDVSAKALSSQAAKGVPLGGNLKLIADTYDSFDRALQDAGKVAQRSSGPFSLMDAVIGVGASIHNPALVALIGARPLARGIMESGPYQRSFIKPPTLEEQLNKRKAMLNLYSTIPPSLGQGGNQ